MLSATSGSHVPVAPVLSLRDCSYLGAKGLLKDRAELGRGAAWGQGHGGHQPQVGASTAGSGSPKRKRHTWVTTELASPEE